MNWYVAKIVFHIDVNQGENQKQFDEQFRLVAARSRQESYYKASVIGQTEEENFTTSNQKTIVWKFIDVAELHEVTEMKDGMEIYSTTHETNEPDYYIQNTKIRAAQLSSLPSFQTFAN